MKPLFQPLDLSKCPRVVQCGALGKVGSTRLRRDMREVLSFPQALLEFLTTVMAQEPSNKMTLWNVSLVMAPNLFLHPGQSPKLSKGRENSWQRGSRSGANDGTLPGPALDGEHCGPRGEGRGVCLRSRTGPCPPRVRLC